MSKFKIGQRVNHKIYGVGMVARVSDITGRPGVAFETWHDGHSLDGLCKDNNGWYVDDSELTLLPLNKIVITTDGASTLARLYDGDKVVKRAEAKCAPSDTYDFTTGANLAYDRLMRPDRLTATTPKPSPEKKPHEYKAGDKVRVTGNGGGNIHHYVPIGSIEIISRVYDTVVELRNDDPEKRWRNQIVSKSDIEPYTEPEPKEPVKLYCVKSASHHITKGKTYELHGDLDCGSITFDNNWTDTNFNYRKSYWSAEGKAKELLFPLVCRPAKVGEWVYIVKDYAGVTKGDVCQVVRIPEPSSGAKEGRVYVRAKEKTSFGRAEDGPVSYLDMGIEYLVLDGYHPADDLSDYEWIDGIKGTNKDMQCRGFQYAIGKEYDLGEQEIGGAKGFHFCDTIEAVKSQTVYNRADSRYFKVRGLVKKGSTGPIFCARKIKIVEEIVEPKYYNGKVVCVETTSPSFFTVGKVYEFKDGKINADNGNSQWGTPIRALDEAARESFQPTKFIEYKE
jgi:hypothetical protein